METVTLTRPDDKQLIEQTNRLQAKAEGLMVMDDQSRQGAAQFLKECGTAEDQLKLVVDPPWRVALEAYEKIQRWRKDLTEMVTRPKKLVASKIGNYDLAVAEKRRKEAAAAQAKADAEARKRRDAEIAAAKAAKDKEAVKALKNAPLVVTPAAPKTQEPTKVEGVSTRFEWRLESIFNPSALPREFLIPDERAIKARIKSLGANHGIPGVKAVQVPVVNERGI